MATFSTSSHVSSQGIAYTALGDTNSTSGLILIHGWGCQRSDYDLIFNHIAIRNASDLDLLTIAPDLPGHGSTSQSLCPEPSIATFSSLLLSLIQELHLQTIVLVGHSLGVRIVSEIWRQNHSSPKSKISIQALIFVDGSDYRTRTTMAFDKADPRSTTLTPEQISALKAKVFENMFSPRTPESFRSSTVAHVATRDKAYSGKLRDSMIAYDRESMEGAMQALDEDGRCGLVNLQSSDTASGERSSLKEGERSVWMMWLDETVKGCRQVVVEDSRHFPHVDRPEVVGERIWDVVKAGRGKVGV